MIRVSQEVVGAVIVTDPGKPRPDLHAIHHHAAGRLHPAKWPQASRRSPCVPKKPSLRSGEG